MNYIFDNLYIENFKGFKESTSIKIADINLLTGKNNAGKSSLIELFNLISSSITSNGMNYLKFSSLDNLLSFDKAINYNATTKEIKLNFPCTLKYFGEKNLFNIECTFVKSINKPLDGFLKSVKYFCHEDDISKALKLVFEIKNNEEKRIIEIDEKKQIIHKPNSSYYCNYAFIISHINNQINQWVIKHQNKKEDIVEIDGEDCWIEVKTEEQKNKEAEDFSSFINELPSYNDLKTSIYSKKYDDIIFTKTSTSLKYFSFEEYLDKTLLFRKGGDIHALDSIYDLQEYYLKVHGIKVDEETYEKHLDIEGNIEFEGEIVSPFDEKGNINQETIQLSIEQIKIDFQQKLNLTLEENNLPEFNKFDNWLLSPLSELIFESVISEFLKPLFLYNDISQHPTTIDISSHDNLNSLLKDFYNKNISKKSIEYSFFKFWLNEFGYGSKFDLIEENNQIVIIFENNKRLSSFGKGLNSLLKTLIAITSKGYENYKDPIEFYSKSILILIEPESNLHPDLQSKIADLIVDATNKFNIKFIVETHSEYLIRKLQYWSSLGKIKPGCTILNYFEKDNSNRTIKINQITIDEDGNLSDDFGEGFIDHAPKLMLDLLNLKNKNKFN